ncbi:Epithelial-stromal interaction protein 1 [Sciurus carolinensis]|uniref:Epithelial-stromal interaction protein 1 n=1 Tax=Sciurus carolinensis TaxID=30640 RepID=A0AA41T0Q9_SCICA|nr:Epithelial-stromal interaction protein 1 [Sciurus carolinensis]
MYTRSKVVGSKLGASSASQDASGWRGELGPLQSQRQGVEATPKSPSRESLGPAGQGSTGAYTMIAPNESRRHQIQRIAAQELSNLEKWKEQNRAKQVYVVPTLLGGSQSESEVRQKQQLQLMQNKYQQKSNKLEEKKQLQEKLRREAFREHHQYTTAAFLSRLDTELPNKSACQTAPCDLQSWTPAGNRAYKDSLREKENQRLQKMKMKDEQQQKNKLREPKRQQQEEERTKILQAEHRRVNNAFLDRLQGKSQPGGLEQSGGYWNTNCGNSWISSVISYACLQELITELIFYLYCQQNVTLFL